MRVVKDLQTSSQFFKERYHYLPGDWPPAPNEIPNVIELANLPCEIAIELDLKMDNGAIGAGNAHASVASCVAGGANDPVPFFAVGL